MSSPLPALAVFDVDDTLIVGDSFWPFLARLRGWPRTVLALYHALLAYILTVSRFRGYGNGNAKPTPEFRTFIKQHLMTSLLAGIKKKRCDQAAEKLRIWRQWNEPMRTRLLELAAKGCHIVIASGGLDLYLPEILKDIPYHALICTTVGAKDDVVTGEMTAGNCVRDRKAERVAEYIREHGPFGESWGYGNYPHDVPMLNLVQHRILV